MNEPVNVRFLPALREGRRIFLPACAKRGLLPAERTQPGPIAISTWRTAIMCCGWKGKASCAKRCGRFCCGMVLFVSGQRETCFYAGFSLAWRPAGSTAARAFTARSAGSRKRLRHPGTVSFRISDAFPVQNAARAGRNHGWWPRNHLRCPSGSRSASK